MFLVKLSPGFSSRYPYPIKKGQTKGDYNIQQIITGNHYAQDRTLIPLIYHSAAAL